MKLTKSERSIMNEVFMVGRVYGRTGEKESPAKIYEVLKDICLRAKKRSSNDN